MSSTSYTCYNVEPSAFTQSSSMSIYLAGSDPDEDAADLDDSEDAFELDSVLTRDDGSDGGESVEERLDEAMEGDAAEKVRMHLFSIGDHVTVERRNFKGRQIQEEAVARVIALNSDGTYNINKFVIGSIERNVEEKYLRLTEEPDERERRGRCVSCNSFPIDCSCVRFIEAPIETEVPKKRSVYPQRSAKISRLATLDDSDGASADSAEGSDDSSDSESRVSDSEDENLVEVPLAVQHVRQRKVRHVEEEHELRSPTVVSPSSSSVPVIQLTEEDVSEVVESPELDYSPVIASSNVIYDYLTYAPCDLRQDMSDRFNLSEPSAASTNDLENVLARQGGEEVESEGSMYRRVYRVPKEYQPFVNYIDELDATQCCYLLHCCYRRLLVSRYYMNWFLTRYKSIDVSELAWTKECFAAYLLRLEDDFLCFDIRCEFIKLTFRETYRRVKNLKKRHSLHVDDYARCKAVQRKWELLAIELEKDQIVNIHKVLCRKFRDRFGEDIYASVDEVIDSMSDVCSNDSQERNERSLIQLSRSSTNAYTSSSKRSDVLDYSSRVNTSERRRSAEFRFSESRVTGKRRLSSASPTGKRVRGERKRRRHLAVSAVVEVHSVEHRPVRVAIAPFFRLPTATAAARELLRSVSLSSLPSNLARISALCSSRYEQLNRTVNENDARYDNYVSEIRLVWVAESSVHIDRFVVDEVLLDLEAEFSATDAFDSALARLCSLWRCCLCVSDCPDIIEYFLSAVDRVDKMFAARLQQHWNRRCIEAVRYFITMTLCLRRWRIDCPELLKWNHRLHAVLYSADDSLLLPAMALIASASSQGGEQEKAAVAEYLQLLFMTVDSCDSLNQPFRRRPALWSHVNDLLYHDGVSEERVWAVLALHTVVIFHLSSQSVDTIAVRRVSHNWSFVKERLSPSPLSCLIASFWDGMISDGFSVVFSSDATPALSELNSVTCDNPKQDNSLLLGKILHYYVEDTPLNFTYILQSEFNAETHQHVSNLYDNIVTYVSNSFKEPCQIDQTAVNKILRDSLDYSGTQLSQKLAHLFLIPAVAKCPLFSTSNLLNNDTLRLRILEYVSNSDRRALVLLWLIALDVLPLLPESTSFLLLQDMIARIISIIKDGSLNDRINEIGLLFFLMPKYCQHIASQGELSTDGTTLITSTLALIQDAESSPYTLLRPLCLHTRSVIVEALSRLILSTQRSTSDAVSLFTLLVHQFEVIGLSSEPLQFVCNAIALPLPFALYEKIIHCIAYAFTSAVRVWIVSKESRTSSLSITKKILEFNDPKSALSSRTALRVQLYAAIFFTTKELDSNVSDVVLEEVISRGGNRLISSWVELCCEVTPECKGSFLSFHEALDTAFSRIQREKNKSKSTLSTVDALSLIHSTYSSTQVPLFCLLRFISQFIYDTNIYSDMKQIFVNIVKSLRRVYTDKVMSSVILKPASAHTAEAAVGLLLMRVVLPAYYSLPNISNDPLSHNDPLALVILKQLRDVVRTPSALSIEACTFFSNSSASMYALSTVDSSFKSELTCLLCLCLKKKELFGLVTYGVVATSVADVVSSNATYLKCTQSYSYFLACKKACSSQSSNDLLNYMPLSTQYVSYVREFRTHLMMDALWIDEENLRVDFTLEVVCLLRLCQPLFSLSAEEAMCVVQSCGYAIIRVLRIGYGDPLTAFGTTSLSTDAVIDFTIDSMDAFVHLVSATSTLLSSLLQTSSEVLKLYSTFFEIALSIVNASGRFEDQKEALQTLSKSSFLPLSMSNSIKCFLVRFQEGVSAFIGIEYAVMTKLSAGLVHLKAMLSD